MAASWTAKGHDPAALDGAKQQCCLTIYMTAKSRLSAMQHSPSDQWPGPYATRCLAQRQCTRHTLAPQMPVTPRTPDMTAPDLCPACGARNDCSMASAQTEHLPCWCYSVSIDPEILRALAPEQRNSACLCPRCADVLNQLPSAPPEHLA